MTRGKGLSHVAMTEPGVRGCLWLRASDGNRFCNRFFNESFHPVGGKGGEKIVNSSGRPKDFHPIQSIYPIEEFLFLVKIKKIFIKFLAVTLKASRKTTHPIQYPILLGIAK
jgi:hypothetical protein